MKLNHVVVIYKKPSKLRGGTAHQKSHLDTIVHVQKVLRKLGIAYKIVLREKLEPPHPFPPPRGGRVRERVDLIITIGGDGTVLAASHFASNIPIIGVNSMPKASVGFFCLANPQTFEKQIRKIIAGRLRPTLLPLLDASIDGKRLPYLALNDVLFASSSPAETVQYIIQIGKRKERQRGSGVWISAGPGSTAGICSAGGKPDRITSRRIQFLARELYPIPRVRYHMKRGFVPLGKPIRIVSGISHGIAFLDGTKLAYPLPRGSVLTVRIARQKLRIFL